MEVIPTCSLSAPTWSFRSFTQTFEPETDVNVERDMTALAIKDHVGFSIRSIDSLVDLVAVLREDTDLPPGTDLSLETARAIKCIFDNLAWSDGEVSRAETQHLLNMIGQHEWLRNAYLQIDSSEPCAKGINKIPNLVFLALDHDERNETHYAPMIVNSLEMIAYGVITADGVASMDELDRFREHLAAMRQFLPSTGRRRS